jgi:hypothetical protein
MDGNALLNAGLRRAGRLLTAAFKLRELDTLFGDVDCHGFLTGNRLGFFAWETKG